MYSIFINTTESFSDCWIPFFKLFKEFWPTFQGKLILNTEQSQISYSGLDIICQQNKQHGKRWGKCFLEGLQQINDDYILYMQEDYFLKEMVDNERMNHFFNEFVKNDFDCLHLTDQCYSGPFKKNLNQSDIWELLPGSKFRVSTQAAFWKKSTLVKLIREWETGWQFEKFATLRANIESYKIMAVDQHIYGSNKHDIIPYIFTGIINGGWNTEILDLFTKHDIQIDYSKRGFFEIKKPSFSHRIKHRLSNLPIEIRGYIDLLQLRRKLNISKKVVSDQL